VLPLLKDHGFTVSVFIVVVIALIFAVIFDAPTRLIVIILLLGIFTAVMEHVIHSSGRAK
jgi:hypothetical protein